MEQEVEFPVIIKKGTNDLGKEVVYYLNYSPEVRNVIYHGTDGEELFGKAAVTGWTGFGNRGLGSEDCGTVNKRGAVLHG